MDVSDGVIYSKLGGDEILMRFDEMVRKGDLFYGPSEHIKIVDQGFRFLFLICPALLTKPWIPDSAITATGTDAPPPPQTPKFGPMSDIDRIESLIISKIGNGAYWLLFNKFNVFRPQYLILHVDDSRRQGEMLSVEDLAISASLLQGAQTPHYVIYNCGREAGCSREHKHLQVFPKPGMDEDGHDMFRYFEDASGQGPADIPMVPFKFFLHRFEQGELDHPERAKEVYDDFVGKSKDLLGISRDAGYCPHNVVMIKEWIMVIPRVKANVEGASANSVGMMGLLWTTKEEMVDKWKALGPARVLREVGVSSWD